MRINMYNILTDFFSFSSYYLFWSALSLQTILVQINFFFSFPIYISFYLILITNIALSLQHVTIAGIIIDINQVCTQTESCYKFLTLTLSKDNNDDSTSASLNVLQLFAHCPQSYILCQCAFLCNNWFLKTGIVIYN